MDKSMRRRGQVELPLFSWTRKKGTIPQLCDSISLRSRLMTDEQEVLKIVTTRLESAGIRYMLTGSIAANFYTTPRMTRDIDIIVEVGEKDTERLFALFSDDFYADRDSIKTA